VEGAGVVCVACDDVVVEDAAGVAAGAVRVAGNIAAGPVDGDTRVERWAEGPQG
jgi:hypothetical protein